MSNEDSSAEFDQLIDDAAIWVSRMHSPIVSLETRAAFVTWLNRSDAHRKAYDEMKLVWDEMGKAEHVPELKAEAEKLSKRRNRVFSFSATAAFSAAAAVLLAFLATFNVFQSSPSSTATERYFTAAGEQTELLLDDGSVVIMNTRTEIKVEFSAERRYISLLNGEAYFDVAHDPSRPFLVDTGVSTTRAVGTAFNIYRKPTETIITITEGVVKISSEHGLREIEVDASRQVKVNEHAILSVLKADLDTELAWQDQLIVFRDAPLSSVLRELNRYLKNPVTLRDSSLVNIAVSGTFDVGAPEKMLQALIISFNLAEKKVGGKRFVARA